MPSTRLLLDRRASGAFVAVALASTTMTTMTASCSSDESPLLVSADDAATADGASAPANDAADPPPKDAAPVDAAALPVVCAGDPCALSLTTTLGAADDDRSEGFCARLRDGTVACWGANGAGQLGRGSDAETYDDATPQRVPGVSNVVALDHTCAIDEAGAVFCWGTGPFLRDGSGATTLEQTPVKLPLPPATSIGVGDATACAATSDGVLCWGRNDNGQVAPFVSAPRFEALAPHEIALPPGTAVHGLAVDRASFVVGDDGTLVSWGANPPLARASSLSPDPYPLRVALAGVTALDLARDNACAIANGIGYCWGAVLPQYQDPEEVALMLRALPEPVVTPEPITRIATTRNVVIVTRTVRFLQPQRWCACGRSGDVFCWGINESGQAGDGTKRYAAEAVKVAGLPAPAADVKTTPDATCALLTNGKIHCWGGNFYGQLGNGQLKVPSAVPQEVVLR